MDRSPNRPRLGRGLSSLISSTSLTDAADTSDVSDANVGQASAADSQADSQTQRLYAIEVGVDQIQPNPHQPRRSFNETALQELADSMKVSGLIQPVVVRQSADGYELIAGERRLRAARLAGMATIPALVRQEVDAIAQAQMALIENIQREDLNPIDRANAYSTLITKLGLSQNELAGRLGEDRSTVSNFLRLLDLTEAVRQLVRDGRLSVGHAKVLVGVADSIEQERLAKLAVSQELSVRNLERLLNSQPAPHRQPPAESAHLKDLEKNIASQLGMRVQVRVNRGSNSRGRVVIHYGNLEQFDTLLTQLGVRLED